MNKQIISILFAIILAACSTHNSPEPPDRPGTEPTVDREALDDSSTRFVADGFTLRYDEGGVIFSIDTDGVIAAYGLLTDCSMEFDPRVPALHINGRHVAITKVETLDAPSGCTAYKITATSQTKPIYLIVSDL